MAPRFQSSAFQALQPKVATDTALYSLFDLTLLLEIADPHSRDRVRESFAGALNLGVGQILELMQSEPEMVLATNRREEGRLLIGAAIRWSESRRPSYRRGFISLEEAVALIRSIEPEYHRWFEHHVLEFGTITRVRFEDVRGSCIRGICSATDAQIQGAIATLPEETQEFLETRWRKLCSNSLYWLPHE
jgi:hypothetical protein